jgi:hypothetical protein
MQKMVCLVVLLVAFAVHPCFAGGGRRLNADCYPENRAVLTAANSDSGTDETGPTWASGSASGKFEEIEADIRGTATDLGGAWVSLSFTTKIKDDNTVDSPGHSLGQLKLEINWEDPSKTGGVRETEFDSGCVAEIQTANQTAFKHLGEVEAELEGGAENFPFYPHTTKAAVASVVVKEDPDNPGRVEADVSLELGYTCNENIYDGGNDIEFEKIAFKNLSPEDFHINNKGSHTLYSQPVGCTVTP